MSLIENFSTLKNKLFGEQDANNNDVISTDKTVTNTKSDIKTLQEGCSYNEKNISLNEKIDEFLNWYDDNIVRGTCTYNDELLKLKKMKDFIEKMAVWYELRYPDYEINRLLSSSNQETTRINDVMFRDNKYLCDLLDEDTDVKELDWDEFYNAHVFIQSLPVDEKAFFAKTKYMNLRYGDDEIRLSLTPNLGIIKKASGFKFLLWSTADRNPDELFVGMPITEAISIMKEMAGQTDVIEKLERIIKEVENKRSQKEEMLNCVMYRIIERGGNRIGPRRAFLFAKEFGRNIDIPMMYGVDYSDPGLRNFINEYLKAGGSKDLMCYVGYFSKPDSIENLKTVSIEELVKKTNNGYTKEEDDLHQKLINVLASKINPEEVKKEKVKQLRLQRKLNKNE